MNNRYYVDERAGCIAVRDRTKDDPEYKCLEPDGPGVIKYWHGERVNGKICETCKRSFGKTWRVKTEDFVAAKELCEKLNGAAWRNGRVGEKESDARL